MSALDLSTPLYVTLPTAAMLWIAYLLIKLGERKHHGRDTGKRARASRPVANMGAPIARAESAPDARLDRGVHRDHRSEHSRDTGAEHHHVRDAREQPALLATHARSAQR